MQVGDKKLTFNKQWPKVGSDHIVSLPLYPMETSVL